VTTVESPRATARAAVGSLVAAVGVGSLVILAVQPTLELHVSQYMSVYTRYEWFLAVSLVVVGVVMTIAEPFDRPLAACGGILAAQLGAAGAGAFKQWYSFFGPTGYDSLHHDELEFLALVLAGLCLAATVVCIGYLAQRHAFISGATQGLLRAGLVVMGVVIIIGLPIALSINDNSTELETLAAFALLYSLPWGIAVMVGGWLTKTAAIGAYLTVTVCALFAAVSEHFIMMGTHASVAYSSVAVVAALAGALRYLSAGWDARASPATGWADS
jgi:hypothetical protein